MSWPLLPVPMTSALLPRQSSPSPYWLECSTLPAKSRSVGMSGRLGMPLTPGRHHDVARMHLAPVPSARRSATVQRPSLSS